jgi:hypothetical protein
VGAFAGFLVGCAVFVFWLGSSPVVPQWQSLATVAAGGVIPVVLLALCGVRPVRVMDRLGVPLIAQAMAAGALTTVVCVLLAIVWSVIVGSPSGIAYIVAPVAAWCGFFALLIGRLLDRFARVYVGVLVVELAAVAVGTVLIVN